MRGLKLCFGLVLCLSACDGGSVEKDASTSETLPADMSADIEYSLTPRFFEDGHNMLDIMLRFTGEPDGSTQIMVGSSWAGVEYSRDRYRALSILGDEIILPQDMDQRMLDIGHRPGSEITISYSLSEADMRDAATDVEYFYTPVLNDDVIHLIGTHALIIPHRNDRETKFSVALKWNDLPQGWTHIDTLPSEPIYARWIGQQIIAAAPANYVHKKDALTVLKVDAHDFDQAAFNLRMTESFQSLNQLWGSEDDEFLITLLGTPDTWNHGAFTGAGRFNSFASAATRNFSLDDVAVVLTHEIAHHWMPGQLGDWPSCQTENEEDCPASIRWFSEGFTDFVAAQVMVTEGHWDRKDLVAFTNKYLRNYYLSSARNATGKAIDELFWLDFEHERQPYWRGFLIAMNWDAETQFHSKGSASAMTELIDMYKAANAAADEDRPVLTADYIAKRFSHHRDRIEDIERYYVKGETLEIRSNLFPDCAELKSKPLYGYDVGFDPEVTLSTGIVAGVSPEHNAYEAGLRNGQNFMAKVSGGGEDTSKPLVLEVKEGERTKTISYIPVGGEALMIPQFEITGACSEDYFYRE